MNGSYRLATQEDTSLLASWWRDGEVMEHAGFPFGLTIDEEKLQQRLINQRNNANKVYIIELDEHPIGELGVNRIDDEAEIGIKICEKNYQNKGIGSFILRLLISNLFHQQNVEKISLDTMVENKRAQLVYERLGFKKTGEATDIFVDQLGRKRSVVLYELSKKDYQN